MTGLLGVLGLDLRQNSRSSHAYAGPVSRAAESGRKSWTGSLSLAGAHAVNAAGSDAAAIAAAIRRKRQAAERIAVVVGHDTGQIGRRDDGRGHRQLGVVDRIDARRSKLPRRRLGQFALAGIERRAVSAA